MMLDSLQHSEEHSSLLDLDSHSDEELKLSGSVVVSESTC